MYGDQHLEEGLSGNIQTLIALALVVLVVVVGILLAAGYGGPIWNHFFDDSQPQASFEFSYDQRAETLTVEHAGGNAIPGRQLLVRSGNRTLADFSAYERVDAGDAVTVANVSRSDSIRVVWRKQHRTLVLATWPR
ncbi:hypothetical protein L593_12855 [Salinarchaeum sp. Harcht-Bsk1]|uniref:type IV pilin N-terminal domain-containing protein n=1 Tax=Salinarchaeum sp. Harcht-Bsk1 TaxID=1333523 RepID=UPI00034240A2|nr:type IV pilin N-terminal domain-containing protein [Salinarchaeum sp. Harcht-Bsk1]AGN02510.1 hypothetical protein L593_12855 [Salinarchaeum sp. Harcht-Bsk1]